ncbi:MAG: GDSL-type esterase/lipase family protein [Balneolaceae bacterium]
MKASKASTKEKEALEKYLLQFLNLEKRFPLLPGNSNKRAIADLVGISQDELDRIRGLYEKNARKAAIELLKEEDISVWVDSLPFESGDKIAAIGDSATDDLQGWFTIFKYLMEISLDSDIEFINAGISYDTSSEALRRLHRDVLSENPDWVIVALGTFDAIRLPIAPGRTLLPLSETWENLTTIEDAVKKVTQNPLIWITPAPVIPELLDGMELFDFTINEKDLFQIREILTSKTGYIVDPLGKRMGKPPEAWFYLNDGINPSLSGHVNTVRELVRTLVTSLEKEGSSLKRDNQDR